MPISLSKTNVKQDVDTLKFDQKLLCGIPWQSVGDYEIRPPKSNVCMLVKAYIFAVHITNEEIQPSTFEDQSVGKALSKLCLGQPSFFKMRLNSVS